MDFEAAFSEGIRRADRNAPNTQALISASNLRAIAPYGLVDFVDVVQPITGAALSAASITKTWPFPQLFRGKGITLLCDAAVLFTVTESASGNWTLTALPVYDWTTYDFDADTASTDTITTGKTWQFLDLWDGCWMLFNGTGVVFKTGFSAKVFYQESVTIKTGATYQDARVFYGGFDQANTYALTDWSAYWASYKSNFPDDYAAKALTGGMKANGVWWGAVGLGDMWWLFDRDFMVNGTMSATYTTGFSAANPYWRQLWGMRQDGYMPMPWTGTVLGLSQLGQHMMVYGTNGISALSPFDTSFGLGTIAGLGANIGVLAKGSSKAAFGGDEQAHAFLDETGDLNVIGPDLQVVNLERRHLFSSMTAPVVSLDPHNREFWVGENDNMYVLSRSGGVARAPMAPTTVFFGASSNASTPVGIVFDNSSTTPAFQTEWFDGGGLKEVPQIVRATMLGTATWSIGLKYLRYPGDSEQDTGAIAADERGTVHFDVSGTLFSLYGTATARSGSTIRRLSAEMSDGERRSIRRWLA